MRYYAFLRAINVGRTNRVRMDALRELCASAGLANVVTYLQTGNVVFDADDDAEVVALRLEESLAGIGLRNVSVMVRSDEELAALLASRPFDHHNDASFRRYVTLFRAPLPAAAAVFAPPGVEVVVVREREVLYAVAAGSPGLDVNGLLERKFRVPATTRYWQVVEGFVALTAGGERVT